MLLTKEFKFSLFPKFLKKNIDKFYKINLDLLFSQENCAREFFIVISAFKELMV